MTTKRESSGVGGHRSIKCEWLLEDDVYNAEFTLFTGRDARVHLVGKKFGVLSVLGVTSVKTRDVELQGAHFDHVSKGLKKLIKERAQRNERLRSRMEDCAMTLVSGTAHLDLIFADAATASGVKESMQCQQKLLELAGTQSFRTWDLEHAQPDIAPAFDNRSSSTSSGGSGSTSTLKELDELRRGLYVSERYENALGLHSLRPRVLQLRSHALADRQSLAESTAQQHRRPEDYLDLHDAFEQSGNFVERLFSPAHGGHTPRRLKDLAEVVPGVHYGKSASGGLASLFHAGPGEDDPARSLTLKFRCHVGHSEEPVEEFHLVCATAEAADNLVRALRLFIDTRVSRDSIQSSVVA